MHFTEIVELMASIMEAAGVAVIVLGSARSLLTWIVSVLRGLPRVAAYRELRVGIAYAILLGLELLVAGDIIRTVAIEPTFANVGVLALIVLIRTFLSLELTLEIEGRWPWQQASEAGDGAIASGATTPPSSEHAA